MVTVKLPGSVDAWGLYSTPGVQGTPRYAGNGLRDEMSDG